MVPYLATANGAGPWRTRRGAGLGRQRRAAKRAFLPIEGPVWVCAWSPDGKKLAVGDHAGTIRIYDRASWQQTAALSGSRDMIRFLAVVGRQRGHRDRRLERLALGVERAERCAAVHQTRAQRSDVDAVAWSPDGSVLATGRLRIARSFDRRRRGTARWSKRLQGHASDVTDGRVSRRTMQMLASGSLEAPYVMVVGQLRQPAPSSRADRGQVERVGVVLATGGTWRRPARTTSCIVWSPKLALVRRDQPGGLSSTPAPSLAWSPDGTRLAAGDVERRPVSSIPRATYPSAR